MFSTNCPEGQSPILATFVELADHLGSCSVPAGVFVKYVASQTKYFAVTFSLLLAKDVNEKQNKKINDSHLMNIIKYSFNGRFL